ncbi:MAG: lytic transglycosylase domain-containing protein [Syntrophales bacterium]
MQSYWKSKGLGILWLLCIFWLPDLSFGETETVSLPVTLDYPFIRSVLVHQLYTAPGQRAIVIDEKQGGCTHIELSNPEVSRELSMIKVGSIIKIRAGVPILGACMGAIEWEGYIEALQRLVVDEKSWQARFETVESRILNKDRKPVTIAGNLLALIETHVDPYLNRTSVDLAPPIKEMKDFLPIFFLPAEQRRVHRLIETLRLGPVQVEESAVKVNLQVEVETESRPRAPAAQLSPSDIERISRVWEDWDAFLVFEIESLIGQPISDTERASLLEILLANRHEFLQALDDKTISSNLVRRQFIWTWQRLSRILRKYLVNEQSRPPLSYLAFFTAADALAALDRLGPTLGLEISRDGLLRLARLLSTSTADPTLSYAYALDPGLREFLGLGPPLDDSGPASDVQEMDLPEEMEKNAEPDNRHSWLDQFLFPVAWAKEGNPALLAQIKQWIPSARDPNPYIGKVRNLLEEATDRIFVANPLAGDDNSFFHILVSATAWQESCWRQFLVRAGKIRYLISNNGSSVGLMQINERVWRGIYRVESLRWNISYNVKAGCEILNLYLRNFALKKIKPAKPSDLDTIAHVTYAMYNGGPDELKHYFKRSSAKKFYRSDRLFREKYIAVKRSEFDQLGICFSGK